MKKKLYAIILLCALHITTAQAFSLFGYDVTSWATRTFRSIRNYFVPTAAQPTRPAPLAPPMRQAPPAPTSVTAEQQAIAVEPESTQAYTLQPQQLSSMPVSTQQAALRRLQKVAGHLAPEHTQAAIAIESIRATLELPLQAPATDSTSSISLSDMTQTEIIHYVKIATPETIKELLQNQDNVDVLANALIHTKSIEDILPLDNINALLTNATIAKQLIVKKTHDFIRLFAIKDKVPAAALTAQLLAPFIANHFADLDEFDGPWLLSRIIKQYPNKELSALGLKHFEQLIATHPGTDLLYTILKTYPETADSMTALAQKHFSYLIIRHSGTQLLYELVNTYPQSAQTLMTIALEYQLDPKVKSAALRDFIAHIRKKYPHMVVKMPAINFDKLLQSADGQKMLYGLMKKDPSVIKGAVAATQKQFPRLIESAQGQRFLHNLLTKIPNTSQELAPMVVANFQTLITSQSNLKYLYTLAKQQPSIVPSINTPIATHFLTLISSPDGIRFLYNIVTKFPDTVTAKNIVNLALDHLDKLTTSGSGPYLLQKIVNQYPHLKKSFTKKLYQTNRPNFYPFINLFKAPLTQTKQHLIANFFTKYEALKKGGYLDYECCPELQEMTKRVIELEAQEQAKKRYTFVHAHLWQYHFFQEIYTDLWSIIHNEPLPAYRFTRFEHPPTSPWAGWENFLYLKEQEKKRWQLTDKSVTNYYAEDPSCQFHMLFMNYALFTNVQGSNSAYYIKINRSENPISINPLNLLTEFHINQLLDPGKLADVGQELKALEEEHKTISNYGGGLLLSFTPETLKKAVYPVAGGGIKRTVEIKGIGKTSDAKIILDTLRSAPEKIVDSDHMEFVSIMSQDCTLIPNNGLDIYEFNAADPVKLAAWRAKKDALMQKIKAVVDQKRAGQQAQQIKPGL